MPQLYIYGGFINIQIDESSEGFLFVDRIKALPFLNSQYATRVFRPPVFCLLAVSSLFSSFLSPWLPSNIHWILVHWIRYAANFLGFLSHRIASISCVEWITKSTPNPEVEEHRFSSVSWTSPTLRHICIWTAVSTLSSATQIIQDYL